ncbi:hypothetical protein HYN59_03345 [Flavobacterium album]|uniref:Uncharacterized protein n=1 Tax=Flavobacterium album TaxID=2175091 RepID=A0A2S1QUZ4_9FLAO|nr:hypothetical protein HYN59_03345 [Flavobacterium album]
MKQKKQKFKAPNISLKIYGKLLPSRPKPLEQSSSLVGRSPSPNAESSLDFYAKYFMPNFTQTCLPGRYKHIQSFVISPDISGIPDEGGIERIAGIATTGNAQAFCS